MQTIYHHSNGAREVRVYARYSVCPFEFVTVHYINGNRKSDLDTVDFCRSDALGNADWWANQL